jgi:hypothetical protein
MKSLQRAIFPACGGSSLPLINDCAKLVALGDSFERNEFPMLKDVFADIAPAVFAALVLSMVGVAGAVQIAVIFG